MYVHRSMRCPSFAALAFLLARVAASGQCPDGTPPPCASSRAAATTARRTNPPLNERAWIVVPFTNVAKAVELDWLRDASVNLLTLDLSRWTDISVVDDKRVTDLLRELPAARASQSLSLNDGLSIARRAGAGRLVMGDFIKVGKSTRLVANVFSVRDGTRMRSITQQVVDQDSLLSAFGPLARGVLAVPPPADAKLGATGTTNIDAYQEYQLGTNAFNRFDLTEAIQHFRKALAFDSTFALAHYKLSMAFHWSDDSNAEERSEATAAARLGGSLPPRERALIMGRVAASRGDDPQACVTLRGLVARDSSDVEALYGLGECEFHGGLAPPEPIDSINGRFRGDWNLAIALFRRVLALDPTYHPAFAHILDALSKRLVSICATQRPGCGNDPSSYNAIIIRDGDSLLIQPVRGAEYLKQEDRANANRSLYRNLKAAQAIAREWVDAAPAEARAHDQLGDIDLKLGELTAAAAELRQVTARSDPQTRRDALSSRVEIAVVLANGAEGRALIDTLRREIPDAAQFRRTVGVYPAALGDLRSAVAAIDEVAKSSGWSPERLAYMQLVPSTLLGVPSARVNDVERRYWESLASDSICAAGLPRCRTTALLSTLAYALRAPRTWWPPSKVESLGFRFGPSRAMAIGDTTDLRRALIELDLTAHERFNGNTDGQATSVIGVDAALALHDSVKALSLARFFVDSVLPSIDLETVGIASVAGWTLLLAPRMMLQRADLAAAMGFKQEARVWYSKVLELWVMPDAELQPTIERVRAAAAKLRE